MREAGWPSAKEVAAEGVIFRESTEKSRTFACVMMKPEQNHFLRLVWPSVPFYCAAWNDSFHYSLTGTERVNAVLEISYCS